MAKESARDRARQERERELSRLDRERKLRQKAARLQEKSQRDDAKDVAAAMVRAPKKK